MSLGNFIYNLFCALLCIYVVEGTLKSEAFGQSQISQVEEAITYYNFGVAKLEQSDLESAIANFDIAITLNPQYANAYYNRGVAKVEFGNYEEAYFYRGTAKVELSDHKGAIVDFDRVIAINPDYPYVNFRRGIAFINFHLSRYRKSILNPFNWF